MEIELLEFSKFAKDDDTYIYFFKVFSNGKEYSERIELIEKEMVKWSCDCVFSTSYRFSKENESKGKTCKHIIQCLKFLKYLGELR